MYVLRVEGMTCGGCVNRVTKAIQAVDPDATVLIELQAKRVGVTTTTKLLVITSALAQAGYPATAAA
ncbi:copper chaperone [Oxalobacteraceae bacterium OM1]|nr:copper chaperone [Oxalobacteraceae bacterium OM1]